MCRRFANIVQGQDTVKGGNRTAGVRYLCGEQTDRCYYVVWIGNFDTVSSACGSSWSRAQKHGLPIKARVFHIPFLHYSRTCRSRRVLHGLLSHPSHPLASSGLQQIFLTPDITMKYLLTIIYGLSAKLVFATESVLGEALEEASNEVPKAGDPG
jgi:hypothetical protein